MNLSGDTSSGKTRVQLIIQKLGYRAYGDGLSIPSADMFSFLSTFQNSVNHPLAIDGCPGIVCEDQIEGIENDKEKLKINKGGNKRGAKVPRIVHSKSREQKLFPTYSIIVGSQSEAINTNRDLRALKRRCITIRLPWHGVPSKSLNYAFRNDENYFDSLCNGLLLWRLKGGSLLQAELVIPKELGYVKNVWEPILQIAYGTEGFEQIKHELKEQIEQCYRLETRSVETMISNQLNQELGKLMKAQPSSQFLQITFSTVWDTIAKEGLFLAIRKGFCLMMIALFLQGSWLAYCKIGEAFEENA